MGRKSKIDLADTVRKMHESGQLVAEAELANAAEDPIKAIQALSEAIESWQEADPTSISKDNPKFIKFTKEMSRQLTIEIYVVMRRVIEALYKKLQQADEYIQPKELANILSELGRQISVLQKVDEAGSMNTPTESEVDKQIRDIEAELAAYGSK